MDWSPGSGGRAWSSAVELLVDVPAVIAEGDDAFLGFGDHVLPAAEKKVCRLFPAQQLFIDGMHIAPPPLPGFPGQGRQVMEIVQLLIQGDHFLVVQQVFLGTGAGDQVCRVVQAFARRPDVADHGSERRDARAGADKEKVPVLLFRQGKYPQRSPNRHLGADFGLVEEIGGAGTPFQQYDDQFHLVCPVRVRGDRIAAAAPRGLFMNGQVQRDELSWPEVESLQFRQLYKKAPGIVGFLLDAGNNAFVPGSSHGPDFSGKIR